MLDKKKLRIFEDSQDAYYRPSQTFTGFNEVSQKYASDYITTKKGVKRFSQSNRGSINLFGEIIEE